MERQGCSLQARPQVLGRRVRLNSRLWCVWTKAATPTCSSLLALAAACWREPVLAARGLLCQASVYIPPSGQHLPGPTLLEKLVYPPQPTVSTCWLLFYLISCMSAQYFLPFIRGRLVPEAQECSVVSQEGSTVPHSLLVSVPVGWSLPVTDQCRAPGRTSSARPLN